jgi:hypothetical protein
MMRTVRLILLWALGIVLCGLALLYAGDAFSVHSRMSHKTAVDPLETTTVRPLYDVPRKDGKDEFDFGDPVTQTCIHSLFPHLGYMPCWYLNRQNQKPIPITG